MFGEDDAMTLTHLTRPSAADPAGVLVLIHGRGSSEHDLFGLFDLLDPERRLTGIAPRGPLSLPPGGSHWYRVHQIGYPEPQTFLAATDVLGGFVDALPERTGVPYDRIVIGGFSQGAVMSFALGLGAGRPNPAGIMALSGFVPTAPGFEIDLAGREDLPVLVHHGIDDTVISIQWGRHARDLLTERVRLSYHEGPFAHTIDPGFVPGLKTWLTEVTT